MWLNFLPSRSCNHQQMTKSSVPDVRQYIKLVTVYCQNPRTFKGVQGKGKSCANKKVSVTIFFAFFSKLFMEKHERLFRAYELEDSI